VGIIAAHHLTSLRRIELIIEKVKFNPFRIARVASQPTNPAFHTGLMLFIASGDIDHAIRIGHTFNFFMQALIILFFSRSVLSL